MENSRQKKKLVNKCPENVNGREKQNTIPDIN